MNWRSRFWAWTALTLVVLVQLPTIGFCQEPKSTSIAIPNRNIPSDATLLVTIRPAELLNGAYAEWIPVEIITAAGTQYLGFDPMQVQHAVVFASKMVKEHPPEMGCVVTFPKPLNLKIPNAVAHNQDGREIWTTPEMPGAIITKIADNTYYFGMEGYLKPTIEARDTKSVLVSQWTAHPPIGSVDIYFDMASNREFIGKVVEEARREVPPPLAFLFEMPELLDAVRIHYQFTESLSPKIVMTAGGPEQAKRLQEIISAGLTTAQMALMPQIESSLDTNDPVQRATVQYLRRISNLTVKTLQPTVEGNDLSLRIDGNAATVGTLVGLLLPAIQAAREAASRTQSMNNMKQLGLAMHLYHDVHGHFPVGIRDSVGRPLLSWRVEILPFLEQQALFESFHLDEPWNSEHNSKLIDKMPPLLAPPGVELERGYTSYQGVAGASQLFSGKIVSLKEITDGTSNSAMVVETNRDAAIIWTQPADWRVQQDDPTAGLHVRSGNGHLVLFIDGSVQAVLTDPQSFWGMTTISGGEVINR